MARTPSTFFLNYGDSAPDFDLQDPQGKSFNLGSFVGSQGLLVMFLSNHCPFVKLLKTELSDLCHKYSEKGIASVAIMSNDIENYPDDRPELMAEDSKEFNYPFPYLYDPTQEVAKAYGAACTPDFFLFDKSHKLYYMGQFDDARPGGATKVTGDDMRRAFDSLLEGIPLDFDPKPSLGCNIKWIKGNEPEYYG